MIGFDKNPRIVQTSQWKSNVNDNARMSKVEDWMQIWIRRRREWNLERLIMDEDVEELN